MRADGRVRLGRPEMAFLVAVERQFGRAEPHQIETYPDTGRQLLVGRISTQAEVRTSRLTQPAEGVQSSVSERLLPRVNVVLNTLVRTYQVDPDTRDLTAYSHVSPDLRGRDSYPLARLDPLWRELMGNAAQEIHGDTLMPVHVQPHVRPAEIARLVEYMQDAVLLPIRPPMLLADPTQA